MKILVVDDNADDRKVLRYNLENHGCKDVIEAEDGQEGFELAKAQKPDLIISDALMPTMDGYQFLRSVKTDETLKSIPFIFYSAVYTGYKEADLATSLGAEAFIIKPKDPQEFWEEVLGILEECKLRKPNGLTAELIKEEEDFLRKYSHIVAAKLEEKTRELQKEIDERKKSDELIKNILESVDEGFIIIDREFRIISANRAYCKQVNAPDCDIIGRYCYEVSHHFHKPCFESEGHPCAVNHVFETGEHGTAVHTHYDKEGNPLYVESKAYPLSKDETGKVITVIEIIVDITERRKLEEQLRQSQKMEAVGRLAGGIAHDFNNILTAIIGYSSLLLGKIKEDDPNRHMAQMILESGERAAQLTQSLLAFSRKQIILLKTVDINEIIRKVERLLQRVIGEDIDLKIITPSRRLSGHTPLNLRGGWGELIVKADAGQIEQALMNLATNARDAMPNGGELIIGTETVTMDEGFVTAHGYGKPGKYALISVSDTGIGMDDVTRLRIFEPFFTTKEVGKGTGLGLSIVYGVVKQHDGFINVYSEPGKGTTFKIYLPITKEMVEEKRPAESFMETGGAETILVAEDDEAVRRLTKSVLSQAGYTVIEAVDGEDAVNKFRENKDKIDLLLFDVVMPRMDGKAAYDRIAEIRPDIKAIFASGYTQNHVAKKGVLGEGFEFIYKPFSPSALLKKVREVIGKK